MGYLSPRQRRVQDFWQMTHHHRLPTFFFTIVAACAFDAPVRAYFAQPWAAPKGAFVEMTVYSAERRMERAERRTGRPLAAIIQDVLPDGLTY
eukprot:8539692-Pyramimonas_sp.AAC.1